MKTFLLGLGIFCVVTGATGTALSTMVRLFSDLNTSKWIVGGSFLLLVFGLVLIAFSET